MISIILLSAALTASADSCQPASTLDAATLLRRAVQATGLDRHRTTVLKLRAFDVTQHTFESDRTYPPSLAEVKSFDEWFDASTGAERIDSHATIAGYEFDDSTIGGADASYAIRDTALVASESTHGMLYETRPLNVWAMLEDWLAATDVRVAARCQYRDYSRVVLTRRGVRGEEQLYVDPKTGYPIKLDRVEPHYLWGQLHVEFVYSTWERVGDAHLPGSTFRLEDGTTMVTRTFGERRFVPRDSVPSLTVPARSTAMAIALPAFLAPTKPDTVRVSNSVYLLRNRGFAETIALARDTVFVFDATQGEARVQEDSAWIAKLFPGRHPIVLVVTDLAWPHVAGVRAWVARGATIVAHPAARDFLSRVVTRQWTLAPDLLERRRHQVSFRFRAVADSLLLAGGNIVVFPIDGVASEVALAAFVRPSRYLWASDYVQNLREPTQYVDEVVAAVARMGISPAMVAAEHTPLTPWDRVAKLAERPAAP
jgi:hypothetical protein